MIDALERATAHPTTIPEVSHARRDLGFPERGNLRAHLARSAPRSCVHPGLRVLGLPALLRLLVSVNAAVVAVDLRLPGARARFGAAVALRAPRDKARRAHDAVDLGEGYTLKAESGNAPLIRNASLAAPSGCAVPIERFVHFATGANPASVHYLSRDAEGGRSVPLPSRVVHGAPASAEVSRDAPFHGARADGGSIEGVAVVLPALIVHSAPASGSPLTPAAIYRAQHVSSGGRTKRVAVLAETLVMHEAPAVRIMWSLASINRAETGSISHVDSNPVGHAPGLLPAGAGVCHQTTPNVVNMPLH